MKHIKLFEDYSDEELEGLMGDLEKIGHKHQLVKGKDFGFGQDLKGENSGVKYLYFTPEAIAFLIENGIVDKDFTVKGGVGSIKSQYGGRRISGTFKPSGNEINGGPGYYILIETTSGQEQRWPEAYYKHLRFRRATIIRLMNEFISKIEKIRK